MRGFGLMRHERHCPSAINQHPGHRYHALVGASYATQGADMEAESELLHAQWGYRDIPLWNNLGHVLVKMHK